MSTPGCSLEEPIVERFRAHLRGDLLRPGDEGYDEARTVWNGMFDKRPCLIARCAGAADVITSVNLAREHDLELAVKGGGHDYAGNSVCDDGLVIDLSKMRSVRVDPEAKEARVGPGATWADVYHEAQAFGLATTGGAGIVGVGGFTLGGGISYLASVHGLACDNLVAADVVTAEGELVRASDEENPDLFWGLRGGGGNFGVVTSFEFSLHDVGPEVVAGQVFHAIEETREVLQFYREFVADAPDELGCYAVVLRAPSGPPFPEAYHGNPVIALSLCYAGEIEEGLDTIQPVRDFGEPILDVVRPQGFTEFKLASDDRYRAVDRFYSRSHYLESLPNEAIDVVADYVTTLPGELTVVGILAMRGAVNRIESASTAFPHRNAAFEFDAWPAWTDPEDDEALMGWAKAFHDAMAPYSTGGVYVNMLSSDEEDRIRSAYTDNYERLVGLKHRWDPANLFRMNQNIPPDD